MSIYKTESIYKVNKNVNRRNRVISLVLSILLIFGILGTNAFGDNESELIRETFGGAYRDPETGNLVILIRADTPRILERAIDIFTCNSYFDDIVFKKADYSYEYLINLFEQLKVNYNGWQNIIEYKTNIWNYIAGFAISVIENRIIIDVVNISNDCIQRFKKEVCDSGALIYRGVDSVYQNSKFGNDVFEDDYKTTMDDFKRECDDTEFAPGQLIIVMKERVETQKFLSLIPNTAIDEIENIQENLRSSISEEYHENIPNRTIFAITLVDKSNENLYRVAETILKIQDVNSVSPNGISYPDSSPNYPNDFDSSQWALEKISAPAAWYYTTGLNTIKVGVIDTGVDHTHPDLAANVDTLLARNVEDAIATNDAMDISGHGTKVAGVIGAVGNNAVGITGINWSVSIVPIKIADSGASYLAQVRAFEYATSLNLPIVNISYGVADNASVYSAIRKFKGLVVKSAGDQNKISSDSPSLVTLSGMGNVIIVAASNNTDSLVADSNHGPQIHLAAPGDQVKSTGLNNTYANFAMSSCAAPHVAGAAALLKSFEQRLETNMIKNAILNNVDVKANLNDLVSTNGRLNIYNSVFMVRLDLNADDEINDQDLSLLTYYYYLVRQGDYYWDHPNNGAKPAKYYDTNYDGIVNVIDVLTLISYYS